MTENARENKPVKIGLPMAWRRLMVFFKAEVNSKKNDKIKTRDSWIRVSISHL